MPRFCEITHKKPKRPANLAAAGGKLPKRPALLKHGLDLPELKTKIRLALLPEGIELVKKAGGLGKYLAVTADNKLTKKLLTLKNQLPEVKKAKEETAKKKAEEEKKAAEPAAETPSKEAKAEEAPALVSNAVDG